MTSPPWQTVYTYFQSWVGKQIVGAINTQLVEQVRTRADQSAQPSLMMVDSQSVEMAKKCALRLFCPTLVPRL